jgi:hypothetical protein
MIDETFSDDYSPELELARVKDVDDTEVNGVKSIGPFSRSVACSVNVTGDLEDPYMPMSFQVNEMVRISATSDMRRASVDEICFL